MPNWSPFSHQLDILCNEEILGKDHTLKFVVVTRWRFKVRLGGYSNAGFETDSWPLLAVHVFYWRQSVSSCLSGTIYPASVFAHHPTQSPESPVEQSLKLWVPFWVRNWYYSPCLGLGCSSSTSSHGAAQEEGDGDNWASQWPGGPVVDQGKGWKV